MRTLDNTVTVTNLDGALTFREITPEEHSYKDAPDDAKKVYQFLRNNVPYLLYSEVLRLYVTGDKKELVAALCNHYSDAELKDLASVLNTFTKGR